MTTATDDARTATLPKATLPKAILFDWDNTLVDSFPLLMAAHNHTRVAMGLAPWTENEARLNIRLAAQDIFPKLYGENWQQAKKILYDYVGARHMQEMVVLEGAAPLLHFLHQNSVQAGVVSNKTKQLLVKEITHLGWDDLLPVAVGAGDTPHGKPDPAGIRLAASKMGFDETQMNLIWYVGDTETDMMAANAAGCIPVYVCNHRMCEENAITLENPAFLFENCTECLDRLKALV